MMKRSNKVLILVIGIFLVLALMIGVTYAYYIFSVSQSGSNLVRSDCFEITYSDGNEINVSNAIPLTDSEAQNLDPYTFTIKNVCHTAMDYNVNIETLNESTMNADYIRVKIDDLESFNLGTIDDNDTSTIYNKNISSSSKTIKSGVIESNESKTYNIRLFIDEASSYEQSGNKTYSSKVVITSVIHKNAGNNQNNKNMVYAVGNQLLSPDGSEYVIKAMGLGNNVWAYPKTPTLTHHDELTYKELSELGFNTVRFYMNYQLFEENDNPYVYKQTAFDWIDTNIAWAKKYNIKLILNLHIAQGGPFASSKAAMFRDSTLVDRFEKLWLEIAERYANEPTILGLSPLNEPYLTDDLSANEALDAYYDWLSELIGKIRNKNSNHLIFIERPYGQVSSTGKYTYPWSLTDSYKILDYDNIVYEYHYYVTEFTGQTSSYNTIEQKLLYGDDKKAFTEGTKLGKILTETPTIGFDPNNSDWQYIESPFYSGTGTTANSAYWIIYSDNLGANSTVYFDDIAIKEYDTNGNYIRDVYNFGFKYTTSVGGYDLKSGGGGTTRYDSTGGIEQSGCTRVDGASLKYRFMKNNMSNDKIVLRSDRLYKVSVYAKGENVESTAQVLPSLQLITADHVYTLNSEYIDYQLDQYRNFSITNNVPIFVGEFGTNAGTIGNEYKGEDYIADQLDYFNEYKIGFSYHDYHEQNWGYYTNLATQERSNENLVLKNLFIEKIANN